MRSDTNTASNFEVGEAEAATAACLSVNVVASELSDGLSSAEHLSSPSTPPSTTAANSALATGGCAVHRESCYIVCSRSSVDLTRHPDWPRQSLTPMRSTIRSGPTPGPSNVTQRPHKHNTARQTVMQDTP